MNSLLSIYPIVDHVYAHSDLVHVASILLAWGASEAAEADRVRRDWALHRVATAAAAARQSMNEILAADGPVAGAKRKWQDLADSLDPSDLASAVWAEATAVPPPPKVRPTVRERRRALLCDMLGIKEDGSDDPISSLQWSGPEEGGACVDPDPLFRAWTAVVPTDEHDPLAVASFLRTLPFLQPDVWRTLPLAPLTTCLETLVHEVTAAAERRHPLRNLQAELVKVREHAAAVHAADDPTSLDPLVDPTLPASAANSCYCPVCDRTFAKLTVFTSHLQGKRHRRAAESTVLASTPATLPTRTPLPILTAQAVLAHLLRDVLRRAVERTLLRLERRAAALPDEAAWDAAQASLSLALSEAGRRTLLSAVSSADFFVVGADGSWELNTAADGEADGEQVDLLGGATSSAAASTHPGASIPNYPVDAAGELMPFYEFKARGLHRVFTCELCGGAQIRGEQAFQRHFRHAQHRAALAALGLTLTPALAGLTTEADVRAVAAQEKEREREGTFDPLADAQVEDEQGNVMTRRTYLDLQRQGVM